ncbi:alanine--tRNA ligase [Saccharobesus litoralis]|uniref:Alanine--tRNA ligase n=1 Tax=Saccharobesus litoralis TaxID=2172099 RepID=A0A2S0VUY2_9ALTE|nr:alanine--tRNA ligase [Saccharobesus litoralis]AWB68031.1 alanine--tRNA ligase [Saccharobesus litoralis]
MKMNTAQIRQAFLDYFAQQQHQVVASSSLVPADDPTLLFTNAGMNQFKDVFLGSDKRSYSRATSSQRCVRAGGKHNDLENVGYTARHHTFFEMLGNFSFGDYFKQDAIRFGWQFLTDTLGLPKEKLLVTVYESDDEAFKIWNEEVGVAADRIIRIGDKSPDKKFESDNFWAMGDTGPCGPCTEIFYDHGEHIWGGPPGSPEEDGDRFIEIWNLVFMQFNRHADGTMENLPKPSVDTGMGLERIAAIMQGVHSNYEIDIFQNLIKYTADLLNVTDLENKSLRVIADHIRSCSFLIADGVMPSNEGRGYVLRRIIRRAIRHGNQLGAKDVFFYKVVQALVNEMGEAYPELVKQQALVEKMLRIEEEQFLKTLDRGLAILNDELKTLEGAVIPGDLVFKLYDTYGFPADLTADVARERDLTIDEPGFEKAMQGQRDKSKEASSFGKDYNDALTTEQSSDFTGYDLETDTASVVEIIKDGEVVSELAAGEEGIVILDQTPFYAESGGQVGDTGSFAQSGQTVFTVADTVKLVGAIAHKGKALAAISVASKVEAVVDAKRRQAIKLNHSATHLMHSALRNLLGDHVSQKGSLVDPDKLRFDFSHFEAVTAEQIQQVEDQVNAEIRANNALQTKLMNIDDAKQAGAMALFGEKYDDEVRVVSMGDYSIELCGGTHVARTGDIGLFKIVSEGGIAAGVRRIEAVTGQAALAQVNSLESQLAQIASLLKSDVASATEKVKAALDKNKALEKSLQQLKDKLSSAASADLASQTTEINGVKVLAAEIEGVEPKALRNTVDELKTKLGSAIIALGLKGEGKVNLIVGVTQDLTSQVKAGELVNFLAQQVGGKGGGRPDLAQAGGSQPENLTAAIATVNKWLEEKL